MIENYCSTKTSVLSITDTDMYWTLEKIQREGKHKTHRSLKMLVSIFCFKPAVSIELLLLPIVPESSALRISSGCSSYVQVSTAISSKDSRLQCCTIKLHCHHAQGAFLLLLLHQIHPVDQSLEDPALHHQMHIKELKNNNKLLSVSQWSYGRSKGVEQSSLTQGCPQEQISGEMQEGKTTRNSKQSFFCSWKQ